MASLPIFDVAGSALSAQSMRLNTIASNLANAESVGATPDQVYRPIEPMFRAQGMPGHADLTTVEVLGIEETKAEPIKRYQPGHPMADAEGYVYAPDIDPVAQMVNMISASRSYQASVEVLNTAKELAMSTLMMGR
jgi:flagellar basal-body rod protein FlgC